MAEQATQTQEEIEAAAAAAAGGQAGQPPAIDWEADTNPYKKRYGDSQGQVTPLVRTLQQFAEYDHTTRTWKPKTQNVQQVHEPEENFEGYDPEFVGRLKRYQDARITPLKNELAELKKEREQSAFLNNYNSARAKAQAKAFKEFGEEYNLIVNGELNPESPLCKLANEILMADYAEFSPDGSFLKFSRPDAQYKSVAEAYGIIQKRAKQQPDTGKGRLVAIQGKGTKASGVKGPMSYEEYSKLTPEQQDAYDMSQVG